MTRTTTVLTPILLTLLGNVPMVLGLFLTSTTWGNFQMRALAGKPDGFAAVAAGAEFSMLGFLAAIMALFSLIGQSESMRRYKVNGQLWSLLVVMAVTMAEIAVAFCLSLVLFFPPISEPSVRCAFLALCGAFGMLIVSLAPCVGLQLNAAREDPPSP